MSCQFDCEETIQKLFREKQKQRAAAKEYYMKLLYNPHRNPESDVLIDPALQRFSAMSAYRVEYFRPTASTFTKYVLTLSPLVLLYWMVKRTRRENEEVLRSGTVSYADRTHKYIY